MNPITNFLITNITQDPANDNLPQITFQFDDTYTSTGGYKLYESYDNATFNLFNTYLKTDIISSTGHFYMIYVGRTHLIDGRYMYYKVKAFSANGTESVDSSTGIANMPISVIENLTVYNNAEKTVLNWDPINTSSGMNGNFVSYEIYKEEMVDIGYALVNIDVNNVQLNFTSDYSNKFIKVWHPSLKTSWQSIVSPTDGATFIINDLNKLFGEKIINYNNILLNDLKVYVENNPTFLTSTGNIFYDDLSFQIDKVYLYKIFGNNGSQLNIEDVNSVITFNFLTVLPTMRSLLSSSTGLLSSVGYLNNTYWGNMKSTLVDNNFWDKSKNAMPFLAKGLTLRGFVGVASIICDIWINNIYYGPVITDQYGQFDINTKLALYNNQIQIRMRTSTGSIVPPTMATYNYNTYYSYNPFIPYSLYVQDSTNKLNQIKINNFIEFCDDEHLWDNFGVWCGLQSRGGYSDSEQRQVVQGVFQSFNFSGYMLGLQNFLSSFPNIDHFDIYENASIFRTIRVGIPNIIASTGNIGTGDYWYGVSACKITGEETTVETLRLDRRFFPMGYFTNNIFSWQPVQGADFYKIYRSVNTSSGSMTFLTSTGMTTFIDHNWITEDGIHKSKTLNYSGLEQPTGLIDLNFNNIIRQLSFRIQSLWQIIIHIYSFSGHPFSVWDTQNISRILRNSMLGAELLKTIKFI